MNEVEQYITMIRERHPDTVSLFTRGLCFQFYQLLSVRYPKAEAWYDCNHVITKIGAHFYDITGRVECGTHLPMTVAYPRRLKNCLFEIHLNPIDDIA